MHFSEVRIDKACGIDRGQGFVIKDLSPGINIIYGPNASGKSTTSRVLQELMWPGRTGLGSATVHARLHHAESQWTIDGEAGHFQILRDGTPAASPDCGPPENRVRYNLALHELIQVDNQDSDFAKKITDASQGGFDLSAACQSLGYQESPPPRRNESRAVRDADSRLKTAEANLIAVQNDASGLESLQAEYRKAVDAADELKLLEAAGEYRRLLEELRGVEDRMASMPPVISRLRGDEKETLDRLAAKETDLQQRLLKARDQMRQAQETMDGCGFQHGVPHEETLEKLKELDSRARKLDEDLRHLKADVADLDAQVEKHLEPLGKHFNDSQLENLARIPLPGLDEFCSKVEQCRAARAVIGFRKKIISELSPGDNVRSMDTRLVHSAYIALVQWLAAPTHAAAGDSKPSSRFSSILVWVAVFLIIALSVFLAVLHNPLWAIGVIAGVVILFLDFRQGRPDPGQGAAADTEAIRKVNQDSYAQTTLAPPDSWDTDSVRARLNQLLELSAQVSLEQHLRGLKKAEDDRATELERMTAELENQKAEIREKIGLAVEMDDLSFARLVRLIGDWQSAHKMAQSKQTVLHETEKTLDAVLNEVNELLGQSGIGPADSYDAFSLKLRKLETRVSDFRTAKATLDATTKNISDFIEPELSSVARERSELFKRLEIGEDKVRDLDIWLNRRDEWIDLHRQLDELKFASNQRLAAVESRQEFLNLDESSLTERIADARSLMDRRDELHAEIVRVKHEIRIASEGHNLTDALAHRESTLMALRDARDEATAAVVGNTLAKWIRRESVDRSRPEVFRRANELLAAFTGYTLSLEIQDESDPPSFKARRGDGPLQSVNELSVGERVQLLLAVRVAFMEQDEPAPLPMFLDETLGTSDDLRADQIISAVIELSRQGRQIFYFTAQRDEVAKWKTAMEERGVPFNIMDLGRIRQLQAAESLPMPRTLATIPEVPHPADHSYRDYAGILSVPGLDPAAIPSDRVHLWHVMDDPHQLHSLLRLHITTCGQLKTLAGSARESLVDQPVMDRTLAAIRALEDAFREWSRGRTRPVDRQALMDSGAVSDNFIDILTEHTRRLSGDAAALIAALENREVPRWQNKNTEILREYFREHGYLSDEIPLTVDQIRTHVLAASSTDINNGLLPTSLIERILRSLPNCQ